ncbi:MAG: FkbM family methyltransferase [Pseudomonadota bacterium]
MHKLGAQARGGEQPTDQSGARAKTGAGPTSRAFQLFEEFAQGLGYAPAEGEPDADRVSRGQKFHRSFPSFAKSIGYTPAVRPGVILQSLDLEVSEVIDGGVAHGTPWLYQTVPKARFVLVDPQRRLRKKLKWTPENFTIVKAALAAQDGGTMTLHENKALSSLKVRTGPSQDKVAKTYEVDLTTLDTVIEQEGLTGPLGIKLDLEGYEYEALQGLDRHLDKVAFLLAEVSVLNRFEDSYRFEELLALTSSKGLRMLTFMNVPRARQPLPFFDCLFLPEDHPAFAWDK